MGQIWGCELSFVVKRDGVDFTRQTQGLTPETPPQCLAVWGTTVPKEGHGVGVGVLVIKENYVQLSGLPMLLSRKPVVCFVSRPPGLLEPLLPLRKRTHGNFKCQQLIYPEQGLYHPRPQQERFSRLAAS